MSSSEGAHKLWLQRRKILAFMIHSGTKIGSGILLDHATGIVVGETTVIGNKVSILYNVTLGEIAKVHVYKWYSPKY